METNVFDKLNAQAEAQIKDFELYAEKLIAAYTRNTHDKALDKIDDLGKKLERQHAGHAAACREARIKIEKHRWIDHSIVPHRTKDETKDETAARKKVSKTLSMLKRRSIVA